MLILNKLLRLFISFFFIALVSFVIIRLIPGDPVTNILGERGASPERIQELRQLFGLDQSWAKQFQIFIVNALQGNFGDSIVSHQTVISEFRVLLPATIELSFFALLWSSIVGLALGILAAMKRNSIWDYGAVTISTIGFAMPIFWWALLAIFFFSVQLQWLPVSGRIGVEFEVPFVSGFYLIDSWFSDMPWASFQSSFVHLILPAFILGTIPLALITRITRSAFIDVEKEDFIRTARAKGLSHYQIIFKHILKNALPQIVTAIGLALGQLLTGAIITETLFSWPGLGRWLIKSIEARDYPVVQAGLFYSMCVIAVTNVLVDMLVEKLNPKLKVVS
ncbi:MAG: ABC transporter permease [Pseudobdellovibrio sp.]